MSSRGNAASEQDQPNKRIRLSEPIAKQEPADKSSGPQTVASQVAITSTSGTTTPIRGPSNPVRHANDPTSSTAQTSLPRAKLEDIAGAQQSSRSTPMQIPQNGKPTPLNLGHVPGSRSQVGPATPTPMTANGTGRPNPMLASHTSRYVYPAAATPVMSRTPSAGSGSLPTANFNASHSTPQRTPHPLSGNVAQGPLGRLVPPSSAGVRTPNTPNTAFSTTSGLMTGRSVTNLQATPNRASPLSGTIPPNNMAGMRNGSASRAGTPTTMGYAQGQPPQVMPISRLRTAEDARTIRETEQL